MSRYLHRAMSQLLSTFQAQLTTELTDVETDNSLTAGTLVAPKSYIAAFEPGRNVTPLLMIYEDEDDSFSFTHDGVGQRAGNEMYAVSATVMYLSNTGQDVATGTEYLRHVLTAMIQVVENNRNLGVADLEVSIQNPMRVGMVLDDLDNESSTRRGVRMPVKVYGNSPP